MAAMLLDFGYRPTSDKLYKLILDGTNKKMTTIGFLRLTHHTTPHNAPQSLLPFTSIV